MTPKEKAKELVDRCYWVFGDGYLGDQHIQCALIAVDELIENQNGMQDFLLKEIGYLIPSPTYWQEVKQEIEKIEKI